MLVSYSRNPLACTIAGVPIREDEIAALMTIVFPSYMNCRSVMIYGDGSARYQRTDYSRGIEITDLDRTGAEGILIDTQSLADHEYWQSDAGIAELAARTKKRHIRGKIENEVADDKSLLGTTADASALALVGLAEIVLALHANGSAAVKAAIADAQDGKLLALANDLTSKLQSGEIKLPALEKDLTDVTEEIGSRSTGVAEILNGEGDAEPQG